MSRFSIDPPDDDRYSDKPIDAQDIDVPDFDAPDVLPDPYPSQKMQALAVALQADYNKRQSEVLQTVVVIDPAEHAAHALIEALATWEQQIALATTLADSGDAVRRLVVLKKLTKRAFDQVDRIDQSCTAAIDRIQERRR